MKIGIYNEPSGNDVGGSEYSVAILAEALAPRHSVEIVHHIPSLTAAQLADFFGLDMSGVRLRYVPVEPDPAGGSRLPWRRLREAREWKSDLSEPYDVFINFAEFAPPFCKAPIGVLMVLFPYSDPTWAWKNDPGEKGTALWKRLRGAYYRREWRQRMATYRVKIANSGYTASWVKRRWGPECQVVYPPTDVEFKSVEKTDVIVSISRFNSAKKQLEMMDAFRKIDRKELADWKFFCVGGVGNSSAGRDYYEKVAGLAAGSNGEVVANAERARVWDFYERAKVFWHATGWGEDEKAHPERMEHFGIVTVEAMAAGCVPVVINRGGQGEIVEHGVSGFLWNNAAELIDYTAELARDDALRARMSAAARARAKSFSRQKYVERFQAALDPFLT